MFDGTALPSFIKFKDKKITINPIKAGKFQCKICLDDLYSPPNCKRFSVKIEEYSKKSELKNNYNAEIRI